MFKVILLDDEETIIEGLKILIDWNSLGFEIIGEGYDGDEGFEIIKSLKPDVLITDIKMPGLTGLELIDRIKTVVPDIKIIILSGYDQFDYAKSAIEKGVLGYLLKPVKKAELTEKLINIKKMIENELLLKQKQKNLEDKLNYLYPIARYKYASDILTGNIKINSAFDLDFSLLNIDKISNYFCVIIYQLSCDNSSWAKIDILNYLDNYVKDKKMGVLFELAPDKLVLWNFIYNKNYNIDNTILEIRNILSDLNINEVSVGVSSISNKLDALHELFNEAKAALDETFKYGKGITMYYNNIMRSDENSLNLFEFKKQIICCLDLLDIDKTIAVINKMFEFMYKDVKSSSNNIYVECINIFVYLKDMAIEYDLKNFPLYNYNYFNINYLRENYNTYDSLKKFLLQVIDELIDAILKKPKNSVYMLVKEIQNYIKDNYAIATRESVAEYFHINPTYLSKIFKQITQVSFIDFLTQIKMEEAKKLLLSSPIQVQELSEKLGYSKSQYFSQIFEKYTGLTPSKFRKKYMKGQN